MDHESADAPLEEAQEIVERLLDRCRPANSSAEEDEDEFICFLALIKRNPDLRARFVHLFTRMLRAETPAPYHLIAFCMHELQWPEIEQIALEEMRHGHPRNFSLASETAEAYEGAEWFGRLVFPYYRSLRGD
jgi:hypothetical protein